MKDELISFETSKLAKEKGFEARQYSIFNYSVDIEEHTVYIQDLNITINREDWTMDLCIAPQSLLQRWLREIHKIHVNPVVNYNIEGSIYGSIYFVSITTFYEKNLEIRWVLDERFEELRKLGLATHKIFKTYEEALEEGLYEALKLIK